MIQLPPNTDKGRVFHGSSVDWTSGARCIAPQFSGSSLRMLCTCSHQAAKHLWLQFKCLACINLGVPDFKIVSKRLAFEKIVLKYPVLTCRESNPNLRPPSSSALHFQNSSSVNHDSVRHQTPRNRPAIDSATQPDRSQALTGKAYTRGN